MINRIATKLTCNDIWCGNIPWRESCPPKTRFCLNNSTSRWRETNFSSSVTGIRFAISFRLIPTWSKSSISNFCFVMIISSGKSWPRNLSQISVVWVFPGYFWSKGSTKPSLQKEFEKMFLAKSNFPGICQSSDQFSHKQPTVKSNWLLRVSFYLVFFSLIISI